jgi:DNA-binding transcriptional regulator YbjK
VSECSVGVVMENTKDQIISAAIVILEKQNYQNMTTSAIARKAGIAEGTIYVHFKSKKELFIAVLRHISDALSSLLINGVSPDKDIKENLRVLAENFIFMKDKTDRYYRIIYKAFSEVEDDEIKYELGQIYTGGIKKIREIIWWSIKKEGIKVAEQRIETILIMLWGIGDIMWKQKVISNNRQIDEHMISRIIDTVYALFLQKY